MNPAGIDSRCSPACARARDFFVHWWGRATCVGLIAAISLHLGIDLYRTTAIDRSLEAMCQAGGMFARDEDAQGQPVVAIDLDSYMIDDTGQVHHRGRATDQLLALLPRFVQLRELSLAKADVTDAGLPHLTELKALTSVNLRGTQVTDAGVLHLGRCLRLRWVDLRETNVTSKGVDFLRGALPGTDILMNAE
jgi:Leucine Rich repeat